MIQKFKELKLAGAFKISISLLCLASFFGLVLRFAFSADLPSWISFPNVKHAHSHVALLGWLFATFFLAIIHMFDLNWAKYRWLFISLQISVLGMAITFPITGYAPLSIFFSTSHILLSYVMIWFIWRDTRASRRTGTAILFLRASLIFLFTASLGTWSLGPLMASYKGSALYYSAIQWYLHFMFNGWLVYALLSILFSYLENNTIDYKIRTGKLFFYTLTISTILTYALAVTWSTPIDLVFYLNSAGVIIQLAAMFYFIKLALPLCNRIKSNFSKHGYYLLKISIFAFLLKILIQAAVVIPFIAKVSYTIKNFVVGFIHLLMLGCLSLFILAFILEILQWKFSKRGSLLFIIGIIFTEILLFTQGLMFWMGKGFIPMYYELITFFSFFLFIGAMYILMTFKKKDI